MTMLATGSTGVIGSQVVANLAEQGAEVHALTRSPEKAKFPRGVNATISLGYSRQSMNVRP
jgi:uncharacterized protein YbjT (DUF2867 family)